MGAETADILVVLQEGVLEGEAFGQGDIVCVHAGDERRARFAEKPVERHDKAAIVLREDTDARVLLRVAGEDRGRRVARPVIHDEKLEIGEDLCADRFQGRIEEARVVVDAHQHGDGGSGHQAAFTRAVARRAARPGSPNRTRRATVRHRSGLSEPRPARSITRSKPSSRRAVGE